MRQYESIWYKLKSLTPTEATSVGVAITAPRYFHKRIIKAVIKEKWMDMSYKIILGATQEGKIATLSYTRSGAILTFRLSFSLTLVDL